ncbi:hypothetical protein AB0F91_44700 [Amycolatopsis sp. NPDC023774]
MAHRSNSFGQRLLCPGCRQEIATAPLAYEVALANAKKLSGQYTTSQYR